MRKRALNLEVVIFTQKLQSGMCLIDFYVLLKIPISPYLFLLCTEGFHGLLKKAEDLGKIRGVSISHNGPKLTYLLFANDSLIFCRAQNNDCQKLLEILGTYERASGQQINQDKITLFFSKSTTPNMQESIKQALGVPMVQQYEKYLGLPSFIRRKKKRASTT